MSPLIGTFAADSVRGYGMFSGSGDGLGFESIATVTAAGGETTLTFSSIPQGYSSLQVRFIFRSTLAQTAPADLAVRLNGDTANNYSTMTVYGNGTTTTGVGAATATGNMVIYNAGTAASNLSTVFGCGIIDIYNVSSTSRGKTLQAFAGNDSNSANSDSRASFNGGFWNSTAAVTSLTVANNGFAAGSKFCLYGIR